MSATPAKRITDIGPPHYTKFLHPVICKNYGKWKHHEKLADLTLEVEEKVSAAVQKLKEKGLVSPYLRSFVVARINPLKWMKPDAELPTAEEVLTTMRDKAAKFNVANVKQDDLLKMGGGVPDEEG